MEFFKKNILIIGFIAFLIIALGISVYLTQRQTQLKSQAAGPTGTCNGDNTFCLWFDTLIPDQPMEGKDLYIFVVGKNGDTEVKITGDFNSSSADILSGASCGAGDFAACWKFKINGAQVTSGAKNVIFKSTQAPDGRVGGWVTILAAAAVVAPPGGAPPACKTQKICDQDAVGSLPSECKFRCEGTTAKYDCIQSDNSNCKGTISCAGKNSDCAGAAAGGVISVGSASITKQSDGTWPSIKITTNINVPGANNSKTVAGVYVIKTADKDSGNGWVAINKFYSTNTSEPDTFDYQLPISFPSGSYTYGLFQMDDSTVVNQLGVSGSVNYQNSGSAAGGGGTGGGVANGADAGDCQVVSIEGQDLKDFPGMVVNNQYRVSIIMSNTRVNNVTTNNWQPDYTIRYGGGPVSQEKLGITNPQLKIGQIVKVGDTYPFTVQIKPTTVGTYPFIWQLYNINGDPFGGRCSPGFTVFATLPGGSAGPTASPSPTASPTAAPNATVQFRVANGDSYELAVAGLEGATWANFSPTANSTFMLSAVTLTNPQSGKAKFVALQFKKGNAIDNNIIVKSILFLGAPPAITGAVNCEYSADSTSTRVVINGQNLGAAGSVSSNSLLAYKIESWDQNKVSVLFTGKIQGQFPIKLTTDQGQSISSTCQVGLTTVNFSLTTLCANVTQQNGGYNSDNIKVKIYKNVSEADASAPSVSQTIRVTGGQVQSFAPSLEANKNYSMLIKAPKSPQKRLDFRTQSGTTDLGTITLRIGDIAPVNNPDGDGFVNAIDISELYREWSINKDVATIGDVNGDSRVNSVDYSCIKQNYDASKGNETFSPPASSGNNGAGSGGGSNTPNTISITTNGRVFLDANANKLYDSGETLSPNVTVQLLKVPDSHVVGQPLNSSELAQSNILAQTTTDSSGAFRINFNAVNQNLKLSFYVQASAGTNNSPGQVDGSGALQSLNNLSTNIQLGGIDIPVPYVGVLNMNVSQL